MPLTLEDLKPKTATCSCGKCRLGHWPGNEEWHYAGTHISGECPDCGDPLPDPRTVGEDTVVINIGDHTQSAEFRAAREAYETYLHIETAQHHDACEQDYWYERYQDARIAAGLPRDAPERYGWRHLWDGTEHQHWLG